MPRPRGKGSGWGRGRGLLGPLDPLIGAWETTAESPRGPIRVERVFTRVHGGRWVRLEARWAFAEGVYEETAMFGRRTDGTLGFWSFTSDGKHSKGWLAEAPDLPAQAIAFEADMPAGRARQAYWPAPAIEGEADGEGGVRVEVEADGEADDGGGVRVDDGADDAAGFVWVVESRTKTGWSRFTEHRYRPPARPPDSAGVSSSGRGG